MKKLFHFVLFCSLFISISFAQTTSKMPPQNARPKLVVGIVIDQMRWDYLYRFYDRYSDGGFKRLMNDGFNCENTFIPYTPTVTAAGHTCIYTGSVPAIHGIVGNNFYDYKEKRKMYCSEDNTVQSLGTTNDNGKMSPKNMLVTTICDELKLATNFKSKVIGISIKDRGAILPAGHSADAAYWYDGKTGNFISSTYYMKALPKWVQDFNATEAVNKYYKKDWNTLYPISTYTESDVDSNFYENTPFGKDQIQFPYTLSQYIDKKDFSKIRTTPYGNSLTFDFAKSALINEQLGKDAITDFLAVSFSSPDYIGHSFGPNAIEVEDAYLRLDKELAEFLVFLDKQVGEKNYTLFLSADHGVAHNPSFLDKHKLPNGGVDGDEVSKKLNVFLKERFGYDSICLGYGNYQFYLNHELIEQKKLEKSAVIANTISYLKEVNGIDRVIEYSKLEETILPKSIKEMFVNGYYPNRCGDVVVILKPGYIDDNYNGKGSTHGLWNPYDAHIPLLFYGNEITKGKTYEKVFMTDIAPTLSSLLHIQIPSGCVGNVIEEVIKK